MTDAGRNAAARAAELVRLFVADPADFGAVEAVPPDRVPEPFRSLLDHASHMTVAMERLHRGPVALRVVAESAGPGDTYAREIILDGPGGGVVQHGIVRIDLAAVGAATASRIRAHEAPLGRILVEAGALCEVGDVRLLEVVPGPHLARLLGPRPTFGRVATITIAGRPAIELLEIAAAG